MALTISQLARTAGVGVETVRFYQRKGLLHDPQPTRSRAESGSKHYSEEDVRQLRFIRSAKDAGFILDEIAELLGLDASNDRRRAGEMARSRLAHLDAEIERLERARSSLRRLARECAEGGEGPCPIIAAFDDDAGCCG